MFHSNKRGGLKRAIEEASDRELRELREDLAIRQERVAQLELEIFETRADLKRFEGELEERLGGLKRRAESLEKQLEEARHHAARRAQWGSRLDSSEVPEDVVEQFRRTWTPRKNSCPPQAKKQLDEVSREEIKSLYRSLAKRFHPDLSIDPKEKRWRESKMIQVNEAYSAQDVRALNSFVEIPDFERESLPKTRDEIVRDLYSEISRLNGVVSNLEEQLRQLVHSQTVKLMLDVKFARMEGRDLLGEMASELMTRISQLESALSIY